MSKVWGRVALLTARLLGLIGLGALCGTAAGVLILVALNASGSRLPRPSDFPGVVFLSFLIGGHIGAVLAPLAWFPLRRVPLARTVGTTAVGTIIGGVFAALLYQHTIGGDGSGLATIPGGLIGFGIAAAWLWGRTRHAPPNPESAA